MNKKVFPFIALGLSLFMAVVLLLGGALSGQLLMPLLAALLMSEFGFILNLVGVFLAYQSFSASRSVAVMITMVGCVLMAVFFFWLGITLWPDNLAG
ncbi:MAG: hypothetical protein R3312_01680 [Gammaproteobacteria bacterium]|nr:hypothetical protein [Gammaproteobacteria bacterium]